MRRTLRSFLLQRTVITATIFTTWLTSLEVVDRPGVQYSYRSGETQLLAFVIEAATGQTLSDYAEEKLWRPMQAERDAYWLLDKKRR